MVQPNATRSLTDKEINILFENGYFGYTSPSALQRAVWWKISKSFGYRARDESRKLCYGDTKLLKDENGMEFLEWDKERGSKTRTGEVSKSHQRAFNPRAFETGGKQCPIKNYKTFISKRPLESKTDDSPFFLTMVPDNRVKDGEPWYYNRPLGKNELGEFLSKALEHLPSSSNRRTSRSKVTNHSCRKTSISLMLENNVDSLHVSQLSGHKNNSYYVASDKQQQNMSNIINQRGLSSSRISSSSIVRVNSSASTPSSTISVNPSTNSAMSIESTAEKAISSAFSGANINKCTFNVNCYFDNK